MFRAKTTGKKHFWATFRRLKSEKKFLLWVFRENTVIEIFWGDFSRENKKLCFSTQFLSENHKKNFRATNENGKTFFCGSFCGKIREKVSRQKLRFIQYHTLIPFYSKVCFLKLVFLKIREGSSKLRQKSMLFCLEKNSFQA